MSGDQAVAVLLQNVSGAESSPLDSDDAGLHWTGGDDNVPGDGLREEDTGSRNSLWICQGPGVGDNIPGNGLREEEYRIQEFSLDPSR